MIAQDQIVLTDFDRDRLLGVVKALRPAGHPFRRYVDDLQAEIGRAEIVPRAAVGPDVVTMNSTVRIREARTGEEEQFTLVYPDEADVLEGRVSVLAPLGMAVLGARVGDAIRWKVPAGVRKFTVEEVVYQPERAGDDHL
jgi:regulator of nucleoside diphosphate kinase